MPLPHDKFLERGNKPADPEYNSNNADPMFRQSDFASGTQEVAYDTTELLVNEIRAGVKALLAAIAAKT